jgi:DNA-binding beta-propeller fold protein YncE
MERGMHNFESQKTVARELVFRCAASAVLLCAFAVGICAQEAPKYRVDPFWPQELPNKWIIGQIGGMAVDGENHIWVLQRPASNTADELGAAQTPPRSECCFAAPPVLEFDQEGHLLRSWGGPGDGFDWPKSEHGIFVDKAGYVWIGGSAAPDRQILKFKKDGKFVMQIGHPSADAADSSRTDILGRPAGIEVDSELHEVYVADGYMNKRVIVFDSETGAFKRMWGAYGNAPKDGDVGAYSAAAPAAQQFRNPVHCVHISRDGLVYVCDRSSDRMQVFTKQGKFVKEFFVRPETLGVGSVWQFAFSTDAQQKFLLMADGEDNVIWTLRREDGAVAGRTGRNGRSAGQFHWIHQIASDTEGNLYTGEVDTGKRIQKFVLVRDGIGQK